MRKWELFEGGRRKAEGGKKEKQSAESILDELRSGGGAINFGFLSLIG